MAVLNGPAGADKLLAFKTYRPGMCLEAVSKALGAYWLASDRPGYYTYALRAWQVVPESRRNYGRTPPKGAVVYFSASGNGYGHIAISLGGGRIASTDIPSNGRVGATTIAGLEQAWGRKYLGWTTLFMGHTITTSGSSDGSNNSGKSVERIKSEQRFMLNAGYYRGTIDGKIGPLYIAAAKSYQRYLQKKGLYKGAIDGIWGDGTEAAHKTNTGGSKKNNPFGIPTAVGLQKIAKLYGYRGALDDIWGAGSSAGFARFLRARYGYTGNDVLGPRMWAAIARWLRANWGYKGNDVPGPVMRAALQRAEKANREQL